MRYGQAITHKNTATITQVRIDVSLRTSFAGSPAVRISFAGGLGFGLQGDAEVVELVFVDFGG